MGFETDFSSGLLAVISHDQTTSTPKQYLDCYGLGFELVSQQQAVPMIFTLGHSKPTSFHDDSSIPQHMIREVVDQEHKEHIYSHAKQLKFDVYVSDLPATRKQQIDNAVSVYKQKLFSTQNALLSSDALMMRFRNHVKHIPYDTPRGYAIRNAKHAIASANTMRRIGIYSMQDVVEEIAIQYTHPLLSTNKFFSLLSSALQADVSGIESTIHDAAEQYVCEDWNEFSVSCAVLENYLTNNEK